MSGITGVSQLGAKTPGVQETSMERLAQQEKTGAVAEAERAKENSVLAQKEKAGTPDVDEYVQEEKSVPIGLYQLARDEEGKQKIVFDEPSVQNGEQTEAADEDKLREVKCTVDTDKVDAEIRKIKEKKDKLEQQLVQAADNPEKQEKLQRQLQQLERDISMKDNDAYRRQHAEYSFGE